MLYQLLKSYYNFIYGVALYILGINILIFKKDIFSSDDALIGAVLAIIIIALILFIILLLNSVFYNKAYKIVKFPYRSFGLAFCTLLFQKISYFILYKSWGYEKEPPYIIDFPQRAIVDETLFFTITKYIVYILIFEVLIFLLSKDWKLKGKKINF